MGGLDSLKCEYYLQSDTLDALIMVLGGYILMICVLHIFILVSHQIFIFGDTDLYGFEYRILAK